MMAELEEVREGISRKRLFWRRVLWAGIAFFMLLSVLALLHYFYKMGEVKSSAGRFSQIEGEIHQFAARRVVVFEILKWFVPCAIISSLWMNVARWKLRKFKKLEREIVVIP